MKNRAVSSLFAIAAFYDGLLGVVFLLASSAVFKWFKVAPPNHPGYIQFPAAILIIFAIMFISVSLDPYRNRNLIPYGILLKVSYCGVIFYHWFSTGLSYMWKPFAIFDFIFIILFIWTWIALGKKKA